VEGFVMPAMWGIKRGDKISTAIPTEKLVEFAKSGKVHADDAISVENENEWRRAGSLEWLFDGQGGNKATTQTETKACPMCGETILVVAKKCKHCGEILDDELKKKNDAPLEKCISPLDLIRKQTTNSHQHNKKGNHYIHNQSSVHQSAQHTKYIADNSNRNSTNWLISSFAILIVAAVIIYLLNSKEHNNIAMNNTPSNNIKTESIINSNPTVTINKNDIGDAIGINGITKAFGSVDLNKTFRIRITEYACELTNISDDNININFTTIDKIGMIAVDKDNNLLIYPFILPATETVRYFRPSMSYLDIDTNIGNYRYRPTTSFADRGKNWETRSNNIVITEKLKADINTGYEELKKYFGK
jgi:hypothetical protein